jgi:HAD superfamily hydrolase (TIGR01509 family)
MSAIRAVNFDLDGLMFNTEDLYIRAGAQMLCRRGHEFTRELSDAIMGRPPKASFEVMIEWCGLEETWEQLQEESDDLFLGMLPGRLRPMPGLVELLRALELANIPKAICTSSRREFLTAILARFDMEPRFQFTLAAEDISHGKPHPEIYLEAARRFGLSPQQTLVFEDSHIGCQAAAAAGAYVVAIPGDHSRGQDFRVASVVVDSLEDPRVYQTLGL